MALNLKAKVLFPYEARTSKEISLVKDDIIFITKQDDSGWSEGKAGNATGWFPTAFVELIQEAGSLKQGSEPKLRGRKNTVKRPMSTRLFGKDKSKASPDQDAGDDDASDSGTDSILVNKPKTRDHLSKWITNRTKPEKLKEKGLIDEIPGAGYEAPGSMKGQDTIYGMSLDDIITRYGYDIPPMVTQCVECLRTTGALKETGIFRLSGTANAVNELGRAFYEVGATPNLKELDCNAVTGAFKKLFRELPEPLFTFDAHDNFLQATNSPNPVEALQEVLKTIPQKNYKIISYIIRFLHEVAQFADVNKMAANNLGIVFGPTLMRNREESLSGMMNPMNNPSATISVLITNALTIFPEESKAQSNIPLRPGLGTAKQFGSGSRLSANLGGGGGQFVPDVSMLAKLASEKSSNRLSAKFTAADLGNALNDETKPAPPPKPKVEEIKAEPEVPPSKPSKPDVSIPPKPVIPPSKPSKPDVAIPPKPAKPGTVKSGSNESAPSVPAKPPVPVKPQIEPEVPAKPAIPAKPALPPKPTTAPAVETALTLYEYNGDAAKGQLSFKAGQTIEVLAKHPSGWWQGNLAGAVGYFPINFVKLTVDEF